ncbi:MFS transporter [Qaidamihabitans albus]|uniref:MFS transporter n=1 Tax=Qaidamihabitans albus TaxID=2795733 RepID=UPI0018F205DB|nr:MFS transporter [Qaidamihabitans albus]
MADGGERAQLRYAWRALSVVSMASVLSALGNSSFNVALPEVVRFYDAGPTAASWMLLAFMLTNTVLLVVFGRLADMFGRRTMYLYGLGTYTLSCLLLGFAPTEWVFIGLRLLQAAGAAMLLANSAALLTDAFPRRHLGRGMGVYIASFSVAQLVGPTLGGFLTHQFGWQWLFWYNVPIGLACLAWGAASLRKIPGHGRDGEIDVLGNILIVLSLGSLLFGLSQVSDRGWGAPAVLIAVAAFAVLLPLFVVVERRSGNPVVDLGLLRDPYFGFGLVASFLNAVARMAVLLLIALFYQTVRDESPLDAGMKILPLALSALIASTSSGFLQHRLRPRTIAVSGTVLSTAGLAVLLVTVSPTVPYGVIASALVLLGLGSGMFMPANATALLHDLPPDRVGIVNALRLMTQSTGVVVSTALALSLIASPLPAELRRYAFAGSISAVSEQALWQLVDGYRLALLCMTVISVLAVFASLAGRRADRRARPVHHS